MESYSNKDTAFQDILQSLKNNPNVQYEAGSWRGAGPDPELLEAIVTRQLIQSHLLEYASEQGFDEGSSVYVVFSELLQGQTALVEHIKTEKGLYHPPAEPPADSPRRQPMGIGDILPATALGIEVSEQPERTARIQQKAIIDAIAGNKEEINRLVRMQENLKRMLDISNADIVIGQLQDLQYRIFKLSTEIYRLRDEQD